MQVSRLDHLSTNSPIQLLCIAVTTPEMLSTPVGLAKTRPPAKLQSTPDVQISRFDKDIVTSKAAFARSQLAKRFLTQQAQQRPVPIQSLSNTSNLADPSTAQSDPTNASSLAATVAASVAVSVTQPFLKLQSDLEQRMNSMFQQLQQRPATNPVVVPVTTTTPATSNKLLNDSVGTRMKYMEKVQEHQQQVLKQLVDMVNTTKPDQESTTAMPLKPSMTHSKDFSLP
jgi:hypothetical protein